MTVILFLLVLTALVFVHELGHFATAKFFGVRVDEFAIGFPPRIASVKKGETRYALNLIPFGGYVKIFGENPDDMVMASADAARSLIRAKWWQQLVILLAGVTMNILFAWLLISISFSVGLLTAVDGSSSYAAHAHDVSTHILSVMPNSPALYAGLAEGDKVIEIKSEKADVTNPGVSDIQNVIAGAKTTVQLIYVRANMTNSVSLTPTTGVIGTEKGIGVALGAAGTVQFPFPQSFVEGAKLTITEFGTIVGGLWQFVIDALHGDHAAFASVAGPVGIAGMVSQAAGFGISYLFGFIALISINLAVLNLVPFPALDGGRAAIVLIEKLIRRPLPRRAVMIANAAGFFIIIALMVLVTYHDIRGLVG